MSPKPSSPKPRTPAKPGSIRHGLSTAPTWYRRSIKTLFWAFVVLVTTGIIGAVTSPSSAPTDLADTTTTAPSSAVSIGEFTRFVTENFGDAYWISDITRIYSSSGALWIETNLYKDNEAYEPAKQMCVAASMFIVSDEKNRFSSLTIRSGSGERLILRNQFVSNPKGSTCEPDL